MQPLEGDLVTARFAVTKIPFADALQCAPQLAQVQLVVLDAVHIRKGGAIDKRRFEARESVSEIKPRPAGEALNTAANKLAGEVAIWLSSD